MKIHSKLTNRRLFSALTIIAIVFIFGVVSYFIKNDSNVSAASITNFKAGNIISDYVFYNKSTMSVSQIQEFLNRQIGSCDTWGSQRAVDWGRGDITRAQFAKQKWGANPPFVCLNNYHENPNTNETSYEKGGGWFQGGISAAQIIYDAAQKYGINPQVLLVMLKKESSGPLTSDKWPLKNQYRYAMGYACPDSGPGNSAACNSKKGGFYKQMNLAAWQLNYYRNHPNDYRYRIGWNNIQYSPDIACGTKRVYIENIATLSLYIYTPYTPNDAALANYPGTSHCGAYGNRNFFMFFSEWFGNTHKISFNTLDNPRWMQIKTATQKRHVANGELFGPVLQPGRHIRFLDKIYINGEWLLRTEHDKNNNSSDGIPLKDLEEIPVIDIPDVWMSIPNATRKVDPVRVKTYEEVRSLTAVRIVDKIVVNGKTYYRTQWEKDNNRLGALPEAALVEYKMFSLITPRYMIVKAGAKKVDVLTGAQSSQPAEISSINMFSKRITIDGVLYLQTKSNINTNYTYKKDDIIEISHNNIPMMSLTSPRWMQIKTATQKRHVANGELFGPVLQPGRHIRFLDKIYINGEWLLRTEHDKNNNSSDGIPLKDLEEIPVIDIPDVWMSIPNATRKVDPVRVKTYEEVRSLTAVRIVDKIVVNGKTYYRTVHDAEASVYKFIPSDALYINP